MNGEKGGCWYLHTKAKTSENASDCLDFTCKTCEKTFKRKHDVMKHRLEEHAEEVPLCNSIRDGKKCSRSIGCWYLHKKPRNAMVGSNVRQQTVKSIEPASTINSSDQVFWKPLQPSAPPDQMNKMMEILTNVMLEVSQLKHQMQGTNPN